MRFARLGPAGSEIPVAIDTDGEVLDLRSDHHRRHGAFLAVRPGRPRAARVARRRPAEPARTPTPCAAAPDRPARQGRLHRPELPRPRRRDRRRHPDRADRVHEGPDDGDRPGRRGAGPPRQHEDRLGDRARRRDRHAPRATCDSEDERRDAHRRLRDRERRLRARVPARARRPVGQGQELRDVQPARPVAGHRRRGRPDPQALRAAR